MGGPFDDLPPPRFGRKELKEFLEGAAEGLESLSSGGSSDSGSSSSGGGCFIATAVYRSETAWQVLLLREFRDTCLATNALGRAFIRFYYKVSPPIADFLRERHLLSRIVRFWLDGLCWLLKKVIKLER
jgi:hypothetical protein